MDYTNALFYTFSTIPQTLAGLLGLLGAFLLFRLQQLNESCSQSLYMIHSDVPGNAPPEIHQAYRQQDMEKFISLIEQGKVQLEHSAHQGLQHIEPAKKKLKQIKDTRWSMGIIFIGGALIIVSSLTVLIYAPCIGSNEGISISSMASGVIVTAAYIIGTLLLLLKKAV